MSRVTFTDENNQEIPGIVRKMKSRIGPARLRGLRKNIFAAKDDRKQAKKILGSFLDFWSNEIPELKNAYGARVYRETLFVDPEKRKDNPIKSELVLEVGLK